MKLQKSFLIFLLATFVGLTGCAKSGKNKGGGISKAPGSESNKAHNGENGADDGADSDADKNAAEEGDTNYANGLADNTSTPAGTLTQKPATEVDEEPPANNTAAAAPDATLPETPAKVTADTGAATDTASNSWTNIFGGSEATTPVAAQTTVETTTPAAAPKGPVMTINENGDGSTTSVTTDANGNKATITTNDPNAQVDVTMNGQSATVAAGTTSVAVGTTSAPAPAPALTANLTTAAGQCEGLKEAASADYAPGLTSKPAAAPYTTLFKENQISYTDSRASGQMGVLTKKIQGMAADLQTASKAMAAGISFVEVQFNGLIGVTDFEYYKGQTLVKLRFYNIIEDMTKPTAQKKMTLIQSDKNNKALPKEQQKYTAEVECLDKAATCDNVQLTVNEVDAAGKVKATAFVLQRSGPVELVLEEAIVTGRATMTNMNQKEFAGFLTGTVINSCLAALKAHNDGRVKLEACAVENLRKQCEGLQRQTVSANTVRMSTWAAPYGRAAFELNFATNTKFSLTLKGPLMHQATVRPMVSAEMIAAEDKFKDSLKSAEVVAQDGAGRLNIRLNFNGEPSADLRFNVTTLAAQPK